jgi:aspartate aminotransferase-like enzyme
MCKKQSPTSSWGKKQRTTSSYRKLKITPHEPVQPLVGLKETLEDVAKFQRLLDEKRERVRKAKQKLRAMGMTVLDEEEYQIPSKVESHQNSLMKGVMNK